MKKAFFRAVFALICIVFHALCVFPAPVTTAAALSAAEKPVAGSYACVLDDAFFYSVPNANSGVFLLPKTYYVRLITYGTEYCKIEYLTDEAHAQKLVGYAQTAALTFVDYIPERPYLYYVFDVTYKMDGSADAPSSFLDTITMTCAYYGDYKIGSKTYCYVLRESQLGYIPKPDFLHYEENTEYAEYLENLQASSSAPLSPEGTQTSSKTGVSPLHVAILIALCLLVPLLAALILKPPRRPPYETDP